jgi:hypothetical protein
MLGYLICSKHNKCMLELRNMLWGPLAEQLEKKQPIATNPLVVGVSFTTFHYYLLVGKNLFLNH